MEDWRLSWRSPCTRAASGDSTTSRCRSCRREAGPVGVSRRVKVWKAARTYAAVSLLKLNLVDFEEGWHHVRVLPWTVDGDPIPMEEPAGADRESRERERAVLRAAGCVHRRRAAAACRTQGAQRRACPSRSPVRGGDAGSRPPQRSSREASAGSSAASPHGRRRRFPIEAKFGTDGTFQIPVAHWLKNIEQRILEAPERPAS